MFTLLDESGTVSFYKQLRVDAGYYRMSAVGGIAVILCNLDFRKRFLAYLCQWCKTMTGQFLNRMTTDLTSCR